jgi:hypothetical protein
MSEQKRKRGRPVNKEIKALENSLGLTGRRVRQIIAEMGLDAITDMGQLRLEEKRITIALRAAQTDRQRHELERQKRLDSGELIRVDIAIGKHVGAMLELKQQLANLPDRVCVKLNPDDPEFVRRILQEEIARITDAVVTKAQS